MKDQPGVVASGGRANSKYGQAMTRMAGWVDITAALTEPD